MHKGCRTRQVTGRHEHAGGGLKRAVCAPSLAASNNVATPYDPWRTQGEWVRGQSWRDEWGNEFYWQAKLGQHLAGLGAEQVWGYIATPS